MILFESTQMHAHAIRCLTHCRRGAGDPFRYVAAEFYDGADKLPEGACAPAIDLNTLKCFRFCY